MIATVEDRVCARPFAVIGGIGMVMYVPNDDGKQTSTLGVIGEVTRKGNQKLAELEEAHASLRYQQGGHRQAHVV